MSGYTTRQRTLILAFMQRHLGHAWTAEQVHRALREEIGREVAPARSTVFRLLRRLNQEGVLMQLPSPDGRGHAYQMDTHAACLDTLHLKCSRCGQLIHLTEAEEKRLKNTLRKQLQFELDHQQATLYGRCAACVQTEKQAKA